LAESLNTLQNAVIEDAPSAMPVVLGLGLLLRDCARVIDYEEDHASSDTPDYIQMSQANLIFFIDVERAISPIKQQVICLIELAHKARLEDENEEDQEDQQREDKDDEDAEKGKEDEDAEQGGNNGEQDILMRDEEGEQEVGNGNQERQEDVQMQDNENGDEEKEKEQEEQEEQEVVQKGRKRVSAAPPSMSKKPRTEPEPVRRSNRARHPSKKAQM
jgi:hypothetical protein